MTEIQKQTFEEFSRNYRTYKHLEPLVGHETSPCCPLKQHLNLTRRKVCNMLDENPELIDYYEDKELFDALFQDFSK